MSLFSRPWSAILYLVAFLTAACALPNAQAQAKPMSEKITERIVPTALESSLETLAKPENRARLGQVIGSEEVTKAAHDITSAIVRGVLDAMIASEYGKPFDGSGARIGKAMREDIAPGVAAISGKAVDAVLTTTLSDKHQQRSQAAVHGIIAAAMASTGEGIEHRIGPALARTWEKDFAPAIARSMSDPEMQRAIGLLVQQIASQLIRGGNTAIQNASDENAEGDGGGAMFGLLGNQIAVGYAVAVFVAFAFGTMLVVLTVMLARGSQQRRKLEEEGRKREEAFLALVSNLGSDNPGVQVTPEIRAWAREQLRAEPGV